MYLRADSSLNTLVDYRRKRIFSAKSGQAGRSVERTGAQGEDLYLRTPVGVTVEDADTGELLGELLRADQRLEVARGGSRGLGNTRFKSSVDRAPRRTISGGSGEERRLLLQLKLLADAALLGLPNAGKSSLLRAVSAAHPKVADYPFTTLWPSLGTVRVGDFRSFVLADIPGLIRGAADGAGLGIRFLRHLSRAHVLLHIVDMAAADIAETAEAVCNVEEELKRYSADLSSRERWLVLNKSDLMPASESRQRHRDLCAALNWQGQSFVISAAQRSGTEELCNALMDWVEQHPVQLTSEFGAEPLFDDSAYGLPGDRA